MNKTIKVKNADVISMIIPAYVQMKRSLLPTRVMYKVIKTIDPLIKAGEEYDKLRFSILNAKCIKDENGSPVFDENNNYKFESEEVTNDVYTVLGEILNEETEVTVYPIQFNDIADIVLDANTLECLIKNELITE